MDVNHPRALRGICIGVRHKPAIELDRALRYSVAQVEIEGELGEDVWYVISGEVPRIKASQESKFELSISGLREYARVNILNYLNAFGRDPDGIYEGEQSLAFSGISEKRALSIGRTFGQEAIFRVTLNSQDLLFVGRGIIQMSADALNERRRLLSFSLSDYVQDRFRVSIDVPKKLNNLRGWHYVGNPDSFLLVGHQESQQVIFRTIHDGGALYKATQALVDLRSGLITDIAPSVKRQLDDGTDKHLVNARIHLDNCQFADAVRHMTAAKRYLYVWRPYENYPKCPTGKESLYVGESALLPAERIKKHLAGVKSSRWVKNFPGRLDQSLMPDVSLPTLATSVAFEEWYALYLSRLGYFVKGGH